MEVIFYNNLSNHNVVNKRLEEVNRVQFNFKDKSSIINPSLLLKNYKDGNYCYINAIKRYYYITDINLLENGLFRIFCEIDVLMSYKDAIINNKFFSSDGNLITINNEIDFNAIYDISKFLLIVGG